MGISYLNRFYETRLSNANLQLDTVLTTLNSLKCVRSAELIGKTDPAGYDFSDSKSLVDGKFLGLPLDDDNEEDKTETRVENWCVQLASEGMK